MLARQSIAAALIVCVASWGTVNTSQGQEEAKKDKLEKKVIIQEKLSKLDEEIEQKVLAQVEKALKKFEEELGENKLEEILGQVEKQLDSKMKKFEIEIENIDSKMLKDHMKMAEKFGKWVQDSKPHVIQLHSGKKRRVIGVVLEGDGESKVKVRDVMEGSAADNAGFQAGDIIVKVNGKKVADPHALSELIQDSKGAVKIAVQRQDKDLVLKVEPKEVEGSKFAEALIELENLDVEGLELPKVIIGDGAKFFQLHKDGEGNKFIELHQDGNVEKSGEGNKEKKIIMVHPKDAKKKIEWKIDRAEENRKLLRNKASELKKKFEQRIEVKSDLSETIQELKQQMKELQRELKELKNSKND